MSERLKDLVKRASELLNCVRFERFKRKRPTLKFNAVTLSNCLFTQPGKPSAYFPTLTLTLSKQTDSKKKPSPANIHQTTLKMSFSIHKMLTFLFTALLVPNLVRADDTNDILMLNNNVCNNYGDQMQCTGVVADYCCFAAMPFWYVNITLLPFCLGMKRSTTDILLQLGGFVRLRRRRCQPHCVEQLRLLPRWLRLACSEVHEWLLQLPGCHHRRFDDRGVLCPLV